MRFHTPEVLFLLLLVPLVAALLFWRRRRPAARLSSAMLARGVGASVRQRLLWVPPVLRVAALVLLIGAAARPQSGVGEVQTTADGVAMVITIDRSWSMIEPMEYEGEVLSRMDVVKRVFKEFVLGNEKGLEGRSEDMIGLVTFARYAETVCPLVRDHATLSKLVDRIELAPTDSPEAGTAIGAGLILAAARLREAEKEIARRNEGEPDPDFEIKSKAIILLTDGEENIQDPPAMAAARLCRDWGIKVYAIGIGGERGDRGGNGLRSLGLRIPGRGYGFDPEALRRIAEISDGRSWVAVDAERLRDVYEEIDELEKTTIESKEYTSYTERFVPLAGAGFALLALEFILSWTLLRRTV